MRTSLSIILLVFICAVANAQTSNGTPAKDVQVRICAPSRAQMLAPKPLFVVFANGKEVMRTNKSDTTVLNTLNPNDIESVQVLKDTSSTKKYGKDAKAGVVEVYMKAGKYPGNYKPDSLKNKNR